MMGRMHCVVPVGIAASLYGPDPGPISVAGSAGVLPDIDEIKSHRGIGCGSSLVASEGGLDFRTLLTHPAV